MADIQDLFKETITEFMEPSSTHISRGRHIIGVYIYIGIAFQQLFQQVGENALNRAGAA